MSQLRRSTPCIAIFCYHPWARIQTIPLWEGKPLGNIAIVQGHPWFLANNNTLALLVQSHLRASCKKQQVIGKCVERTRWRKEKKRLLDTFPTSVDNYKASQKVLIETMHFFIHCKAALLPWFAAWNVEIGVDQTNPSYMYVFLKYMITREKLFRI